MLNQVQSLKKIDQPVGAASDLLWPLTMNSTGTCKRSENLNEWCAVNVLKVWMNSVK